MITLVIAGILVALAGPAMRSFVQDQRLTGQANEFVVTSYARSTSSGQVMPEFVPLAMERCGGTWQTAGSFLSLITAPGPPATPCYGFMNITSDVAMNSSATIVVFSASGLLDASTGSGDYTLCGGGKLRTVNITGTGRPSMSSGTC